MIFLLLGTWEDLHICSSQMPWASCSKGQESQASACQYWGSNVCLAGWMWRELYGSAGFLLADSIAGWWVGRAAPLSCFWLSPWDLSPVTTSACLAHLCPHGQTSGVRCPLLELEGDSGSSVSAQRIMGSSWGTFLGHRRNTEASQGTPHPHSGVS